jgi:hypothetical protein
MCADAMRGCALSPADELSLKGLMPPEALRLSLQRRVARGQFRGAHICVIGQIKAAGRLMGDGDVEMGQRRLADLERKRGLRRLDGGSTGRRRSAPRTGTARLPPFRRQAHRFFQIIERGPASPRCTAITPRLAARARGSIAQIAERSAESHAPMARPLISPGKRR